MNRDENQLLLHNNSICVTNDEVEKREFGERKKVINSLEKITALSNRRLTDQSLTLFSLKWSIDRITIVGFLKKFNFDSTIFTEEVRERILGSECLFDKLQAEINQSVLEMEQGIYFTAEDLVKRYGLSQSVE